MKTISRSGHSRFKVVRPTTSCCSRTTRVPLRSSLQFHASSLRPRSAWPMNLVPDSIQLLATSIYRLTRRIDPRCSIPVKLDPKDSHKLPGLLIRKPHRRTSALGGSKISRVSAPTTQRRVRSMESRLLTVGLHDQISKELKSTNNLKMNTSI